MHVDVTVGERVLVGVTVGGVVVGCGVGGTVGDRVVRDFEGLKVAEKEKCGDVQFYTKLEQLKVWMGADHSKKIPYMCQLKL